MIRIILQWTVLAFFLIYLSARLLPFFRGESYHYSEYLVMCNYYFDDIVDRRSPLFDVLSIVYVADFIWPAIPIGVGCTITMYNLLQDLQRLPNKIRTKRKGPTIQAADHITSDGTNKKKKVSASLKKKEEEAKSWRLQDKPLSAGVSLRSAKTRQALQVGMKKSKLVEQILQQVGVGVLPMPTENISTQFNELRNDILFLLELKIAQETLQFDMQSLGWRVS
eukprot:sb/3479773/